MRAIFTWVVVLCLISVIGWGQSAKRSDPVFVHNGFVTGQIYLDEMSERERTAYAMGVVDGMLVAPLFKAPSQEGRWLGKCLEGMNEKQISEILLKHVKDHPEKWHYQMHVLAWTAMKDVCKAK